MPCKPVVTMGFVLGIEDQLDISVRMFLNQLLA